MHDLPRKIARSKVRLMLDKESKGWGFYASVFIKCQWSRKILSRLWQLMADLYSIMRSLPMH